METKLKFFVPSIIGGGALRALRSRTDRRPLCSVPLWELSGSPPRRLRMVTVCLRFVLSITIIIPMINKDVGLLLETRLLPWSRSLTSYSSSSSSLCRHIILLREPRILKFHGHHLQALAPKNTKVTPEHQGNARGKIPKTKCIVIAKNWSINVFPAANTVVT